MRWMQLKIIQSKYWLLEVLQTHLSILVSSMRPSLHEPRADDKGREEEEKTSANIPRMFLEEEGEVGERPSGHWTRYI